MQEADRLERYLLALTTAVHASRRRPPRILREAREHLEDAIEELTAQGNSFDRAQSLAIEQFGSVRAIAPLYREALAAGTARDAVTTLAASLAFNALFWKLTMGPGFPPSIQAAIVTVLQCVAVAGLICCVAALSWGRLTERRDHHLPWGHRATGAAVALVSSLILALAGVLLAHEPRWSDTFIALGVVGVPFSCSMLIAVRCSRYSAKCS